MHFDRQGKRLYVDSWIKLPAYTHLQKLLQSVLIFTQLDIFDHEALMNQYTDIARLHNLREPLPMSASFCALALVACIWRIDSLTALSREVIFGASTWPSLLKCKVPLTILGVCPAANDWHNAAFQKVTVGCENAQGML